MRRAATKLGWSFEHLRAAMDHAGFVILQRYVGLARERDLGPRLPERGAVASRAGWTRITESDFHPFFHEIVAVDEAEDPASPPQLVSEFWPGFFVGSMLLVRAGVRVRAGRDVMDPAVATSSCLYWAWWRRNRSRSIWPGAIWHTTATVVGPIFL